MKLPEDQRAGFTQLLEEAQKLGYVGAEQTMKNLTAYPVEEDGQVVGLVTKYDFLKCFAFAPVHMVPHYDELMNRTVGDVMSPDFIYVHPEIKLTRVLQLMVDHQTRSIPVVDNDRKLLGIISREDVMHALKDCTRH